MRFSKVFPPSHSPVTTTAIAAAASLALLILAALIMPGAGRAEPATTGASVPALPVSGMASMRTSTARPARPRLPTPRLTAADRRAALEALQFALMEVGDGATFVWHRPKGKLRGIVRPTSSFRNAKGQICRHLVFAVALGGYQKKMEGIACRTNDGGWSLSG